MRRVVRANSAPCRQSSPTTRPSDRFSRVDVCHTSRRAPHSRRFCMGGSPAPRSSASTRPSNASARERSSRRSGSVLLAFLMTASRRSLPSDKRITAFFRCGVSARQRGRSSWSGALWRVLGRALDNDADFCRASMSAPQSACSRTGLITWNFAWAIKPNSRKALVTRCRNRTFPIVVSLSTAMHDAPTHSPASTCRSPNRTACCGRFASYRSSSLPSGWRQGHEGVTVKAIPGLVMIWIAMNVIVERPHIRWLECMDTWGLMPGHEKLAKHATQSTEPRMREQSLQHAP